MKVHEAQRLLIDLCKVPAESRLLLLKMAAQEHKGGPFDDMFSAVAAPEGDDRKLNSLLGSERDFVWILTMFSLAIYYAQQKQVPPDDVVDCWAKMFGCYVHDKETKA